MWSAAWMFLVLISSAFSAPMQPCPKSCYCKPFGHHQEVFCSSFNFLKKPLSPKLETSIVKLTVRGKTVDSFDPKLKVLTNLKHLDVSSNRIEHFTASQVPKSVRTLDISNNHIQYIPTDWNSLPEMRLLNISGNPLSCSCDALWFRDILLSSFDINIVEPVLCNSPKEHLGKSWLKAKCSSDPEFLFGEMQGDEPLEGSGSGDGWIEPVVTESHKLSDDIDPIEEEFIKDNRKVLNAESTTTKSVDIDLEEGSGIDDFTFDKGSESEVSHSTTVRTSDNDYRDLEDGEDGYEEPTTIINIEPKPEIETHGIFIPQGCLINCSTPAPIDTSNETEISPAPGLFDGVQIIFNDIFGGGSSSSSTKAPELEVSTETNAPAVEEPTQTKEEGTRLHSSTNIESNVTKESPKKETEVISDTNNTKNKESAVQSKEAKQSQSTFIFLGVLLLVMVCLIIYAVVKRVAAKKKVRNNRSDVAGLDEKPGEEMKLIKPISVENGKQNGKPESVPLMNSQNGAHTYIEDDKKPQRKEPVTPPGTPADDEDEEDVELRPKTNESLLTPETKRVTIKASEIPDSIPKTPVLITRHIDSDGKVVTTPNLNQRSDK